MARVMIATAVIFGVLAGWVWVQHAYAAFARRHPDLGPFRREDGGCGGGCSCSTNGCHPPESTLEPRGQRPGAPAFASAPVVPLKQLEAFQAPEKNS